MIWVASVPANAAAGLLTRPVPPIADYWAHSNILVTRPTPRINAHMSGRMSLARRDRIIVALINRENAGHHRHRQHPLLAGGDRDPRHW